MPRALLSFLAAVFFAVLLPGLQIEAQAQALMPARTLAQSEAQFSECIAFVERTPLLRRVAAAPAQSGAEVEIRYVGHSTFRLKTPAGIEIATDYAGYAGEGPAPRIATMNHAHETHYTNFPDPQIEYVLRGWNPEGGPAEHRLRIADVLVRNVPTDIRSFAGSVEPYGNSVFIFEVAGLCIGHLGHLHHKLSDEQLARIGRLDVVFAPVDGSYTLDLPTMIETLQDLRASLVIPMHYFGGASLQIFLAGMREEFEIKIDRDDETRVSLASLPEQPTVLVLQGY
jgi:L-ascorbate metabolism protein UlaG (beta-lactamase superfamily)